VAPAFTQQLSGRATAQAHTLSLKDMLVLVERTAGLSVDADAPLMEAGVDSLAATELSSRLRSLTGVALSPTIVFEQPTPRAVAAHLLEHTGGREATESDYIVANCASIRPVPETLSEYLTSIGLDCFMVKFVEEGYDELYFLHNLSLSDLIELLNDIGMDEEQAKQFLLSEVLVSRDMSPPPCPPTL